MPVDFYTKLRIGCLPLILSCAKMSLKVLTNKSILLRNRFAYSRLFVRFRKKGVAPEVMERYLYPEVNPNMSSKINMISLQEGDHIYITKYSSLGFTLQNEAKLSGPTIFFPRNVIKWKIYKTADINEKSLRLFTMLTPKLDMLIIGTGSTRHPLTPETVEYLREHKLNFEVMPTDQAIATFNFQNNDQRWVAAAVMPPESHRSDLSEYVNRYYSDRLDSSDMIYSEEKDLPQIEETSGEKHLEENTSQMKKVTAKPDIWGSRSPLGLTKSILSDGTVTVDRDKYQTEGSQNQQEAENKSNRDTPGKDKDDSSSKT